MSRRPLLVVCFALAAIACEHPPPDATPEGALRELLERFERAKSNPAEIRGVYELLSAGARSSLDERARRASSATGRPMSGADMIAPSRFALRFAPRQMRARIDGDRAIVDVVGMAPATDRVSITCVRENGRWRIDLTPPPMLAPEFRPDGGT